MVLLDTPLPSALRRHAESMKRLGDYASPGACFQRARGQRQTEKKSEGVPIKQKVSFKLAHLGHMGLGMLSRNPWTINRDTWNHEDNKTGAVLDERRPKFILMSDFVPPLYIFSLEHKKKMESCSSLAGLAKHVCHFMNKQSSVCFFLQMVDFPPPRFFLFLSPCFLIV